MDGLDILTPKIEIKMFQLLTIAFSYEFGTKNVSKIELEKCHFNTVSYGLVVKVTPMLPYNFGPPGGGHMVLRATCSRVNPSKNAVSGLDPKREVAESPSFQVRSALV